MGGIFRFLKNNKIFAILLILIVLFIGMYTFDYLRSKTFHIEIVSISPDSPVADGETPVTIEVLITKNGKPIEGDPLQPTGEAGQGHFLSGHRRGAPSAHPPDIGSYGEYPGALHQRVAQCPAHKRRTPHSHRTLQRGTAANRYPLSARQCRQGKYHHGLPLEPDINRLARQHPD